MENIKTAIILCAGKSKRYGRNKLEVEICGKTLPQRAVEFCISNGIERVFVTISKDQFGLKDYKTVTHAIVDSLQPYDYLVDLRFAFQDDDEYGPGAAMKPWLVDVGPAPFVVLFGDNFYHGELPMIADDEDCMVSYINRPKHARNLQLAAIQDDIVIEKPHPFVEGKFFCGYAAFRPNVCREAMCNIRRSDRNEYEITDLINYIQRKKFIRNDLLWGDITFVGDEEKIVQIIKENDIQ